MCPVRRFNIITSNVVESFNNTLLWARRLPISTCLDAVRFVIEEWFYEHRAACQNDVHPITYEDMINKLIGSYGSELEFYSFRPDETGIDLNLKLKFQILIRT